MPSSRHSADTDVSRCAIATWGQPHLGFRQRELPLAVATVGPCGLEPGHGAFPDQLPLDLGQRREDAEHEPAGRGSNTVQDLSARGEGLRVLAGQGAQIGHHDQMSQIAAEAVELPDHETSPFRRTRRQLSRPGRSSRRPEAKSW